MNATACNICGTVLDEDRNAPKNQGTPCPKCGSTERKHFVSASAQVVFETVASFDVVGTVKSINLLLQSVIIPGAKTAEGRLVEAVSIPWFKIIELFSKDSSAIYQISDRKWEEIIAGAYKEAGFDEVTLTPRSGDYGRDVIAVKMGVGSIRVIDQVKAYKPGHLVTADNVRALMGVLKGDGASKGFLTTTSDFAPRIRDDPLIRQFIPSQLELINGARLQERLKALAKKGRN